MSTEVEEKIKGKDIIGAFDVLKYWYRKFSGRTLKPSHFEMDKTRETYVRLFTKEKIVDNPPFEVEYDGEPIDDSVPGEEEIRVALFKMKNRKSPGLTGITVEHLKKWYTLSHPKRGEPDSGALAKWSNVVEIVQSCLQEGIIPQAFQFGTLVIIPKDDNGGVRGIGLLETIHKLISQIINIRISGTVDFCDWVHGFRRERGTHTAIGEAKLRMQRASYKSETVY